MILNHIQYRNQKQFQFVHRSSFIVHIKMSSVSSSSSSSPTAPHVSPTLKRNSRYPTSEKDLELEFELRKREMKKIWEARKRMISGAGAGAGGAEKNKRSSRADACDLDGDEFKIVCEELWIDFRKWVNHNENVSDCMGKVRAAFVSYWALIWVILGFLMWFRWYIGAGKDACSHGVGYGVFSFACEVLRHLGEIVGAFILMIIGFCVGMVPMIVLLCIYEFKDTFPDPDGDGDGDDDADGKDADHLKKE